MKNTENRLSEFWHKTTPGMSRTWRKDQSDVCESWTCPDLCVVRLSSSSFGSNKLVSRIQIFAGHGDGGNSENVSAVRGAEGTSLLPWRWCQKLKSIAAVRNVAQPLMEKSNWWHKKNISAIFKSELEATWKHRRRIWKRIFPLAKRILAEEDLQTARSTVR